MMASLGSPPAVGQMLSQKRQERGLSLQSLAKISGVSKSMISQVENGQVNPTLAVVWKLAAGLGISIHELLESGTQTHQAQFMYLTEDSVPTLHSKEFGYSIQILSGIDMVEKVELYLVDLQPEGSMMSDAHARGTVETLTVLRGEAEVVLDDAPPRRVKALQSARYSADVPHTIRAYGKHGAIIYLAVKFDWTRK